MLAILRSLCTMFLELRQERAQMIVLTMLSTPLTDILPDKYFSANFSKSPRPQYQNTIQKLFFVQKYQSMWTMAQCCSYLSMMHSFWMDKSLYSLSLGLSSMDLIAHCGYRGWVARQTLANIPLPISVIISKSFTFIQSFIQLMGSHDSSQFHPYQLILTTPFYSVLIHPLSGTQVQLYQCPSSSLNHLQRQHQQIHFPRAAQQIAYKEKQASVLCSSAGQTVILCEHLERVSDFKQLSEARANELLKEAALGYKQLEKLYQPNYLVNGSMMGVNQSGFMKVWVNSNLALQQPQIWLPANKRNENQRLMVRSLIETFEQQSKGCFDKQHIVTLTGLLEQLEQHSQLLSKQRDKPDLLIFQ